MSSRERTKTILIASRDPALTIARKRALEAAGYHVIAVKNLAQVARNCQTHEIDLVLLGSSLPPAQKRRFWAESRKNCRTPILELFSGAPPELMDESRTYVHRSRTPADFIEAVQAILSKN